MKKTIIAIALLSSILIGGCKKSGESPKPDPQEKEEPKKPQEDPEDEKPDDEKPDEEDDKIPAGTRIISFKEYFTTKDIKTTHSLSYDDQNRLATIKSVNSKRTDNYTITYNDDNNKIKSITMITDGSTTVSDFTYGSGFFSYQKKIKAKGATGFVQAPMVFTHFTNADGDVTKFTITNGPIDVETQYTFTDNNITLVTYINPPKDKEEYTYKTQPNLIYQNPTLKQFLQVVNYHQFLSKDFPATVSHKSVPFPVGLVYTVNEQGNVLTMRDTYLSTLLLEIDYNK